jgi:hypothetical protein
MRTHHLLVAGLALLVVGCSGGGSGDTSTPPAPATTMLTIYYDAPTNTIVHEQGPVLTDASGQPTATRHGVWQIRFPSADGNGKQWQRLYVNGTWDEAQEWWEYNADGSVRDANGDR